MRPCQTASVLVLAAALLSCSTTQLVSEHVGPATLDARLARVVVIGVSQDVGQRVRFENAFAAALESRAQVEVSAATALVAPEQSLDQDVLRDALEGRGFDGVLVIRKLGERAEVSTRTTGGGIPEVDASAYDDFHSQYLRTIGTSTSEVATRMVRAEVTLLRGGDYAQVWTGATDSRDPRELDKTAGDLAAVVAAQLRAHGLL